MKIYIKGLLVAALLVVSAPVFAAGFNIAQPDSGTEFRGNAPDGTQISIPVGQKELSVFHGSITTASTSYAVIPLTGYKVTSIRGVLSFAGGTTALTQNITSIRFWRVSPNNIVTDEITNATTPMAFATSITAGRVETFTPTSKDSLGQNDRIAIGSSGAAGGGNANMLFLITVQPR